MRKLKLQVQMTLNGLIAGPDNENDWITWKQSRDLKDYVEKLTDTVDTILPGRKMSAEFLEYWNAKVKNPDGQRDEFAKKMAGYKKVIFSKTLVRSAWDNTELAKGDLKEEINKLKAERGKDIIVYGGAGFLSSVIEAGIVDEYHFFVNPAALPAGKPIFEQLPTALQLRLDKAVAFDSGVVLLKYLPSIAILTRL